MHVLWKIAEDIVLKNKQWSRIFNEWTFILLRLVSEHSNTIEGTILIPYIHFLFSFDIYCMFYPRLLYFYYGSPCFTPTFNDTVVNDRKIRGDCRLHFSFSFSYFFFSLSCTWHITSSQSVYHTEPKKGTRKLLTAEEAWEILGWRKRKNVNTGYWREKVRKRAWRRRKRVAVRRGERNWVKRDERKLEKLMREEKLKGKE